MSTDKALPAERLNLAMRQVQCQISRPKSMSKSAQKSRRNRPKLWSFLVSRLSSSARGDLNPVSGFPFWKRANRVENTRRQWKQNSCKLLQVYVLFFVLVISAEALNSLVAFLGFS